MLQRVRGRQRRHRSVSIFTPGLRASSRSRADSSFDRPTSRRAVQDLALEVARVDGIEIDDADRSNAGRREIQGGGRSEPARADAEHATGFEPPLAVDTHFRKNQVPAVALNLVVGQFGRSVQLRRAAVSCFGGADTGAPPATEGTMLMTSPDFNDVASFCRYLMSSSLT